jgi:hypothetical protein
MAYANAVSHPSRAKEITDLIAASKVALAMVGDSNMGQSTGSHWEYWAIGLKNRGIPHYGLRVCGTGGGGWGADTAGLGVQASQSNRFDSGSTDLGYMTRPTSAVNDATMMPRTAFTEEEKTTPPAGTTPDAWSLTAQELPAGQYSAADSLVYGGAVAYMGLARANPLLGPNTDTDYAVDFHYFIPSGSASNAVYFGVESGLTVYGSGSGTTKGSLAVTRVPIVGASGVSDFRIQANQMWVNRAVGLAYYVATQLVKTSATKGVMIHPLWVAGGKTLRNTVADMVYLKANRAEALKEHLRLVVASQDAAASSKALVIVNKHKGNDVGEASAAYVYSGGTATATGSNHNTKAGYKQTFEAFCRMWQDAWAALGYDPNRLYIIDAGYHPQPTGNYTTYQQLMQDGVKELLAAGASWTRRVLCIEGNLLTTSTEMTALSWYKPADTAHLSTAGFLGFNARELEALYTAAANASGSPFTKITRQLSGPAVATVERAVSASPTQ